MYLSNLAAVIKSESDSRSIVSADNKRDYQSNRSYILYIKPDKKLYHTPFAVVLVHMQRDDMPDSRRIFQNMFHYPP